MKEESNQRDEEGRFSVGNSIWRESYERLKGKGWGSPRLFETPDDLLDVAIRYFEWCDSNPLPEEKVFHSQGVITKSVHNHPRPYNYSGLFVFGGFTDATWYEYKKYPEFSSVIDFITQTVRDQKMNGGLAGYFNANLVARDLGLRDAQDVDQKISGHQTHDHKVEVTGADKLANLLSEYKKEE